MGLFDLFGQDKPDDDSPTLADEWDQFVHNPTMQQLLGDGQTVEDYPELMVTRWQDEE